MVPPAKPPASASADNAARDAPAAPVVVAAASQASATRLPYDKADPYPGYARLRAMAPVLKLEWPGIGHAWVITRHSEAITVFKDPRLVRNTASLAAGGTIPSRPVRGFGPDLLELDPPDHTRLRRLVGKAFTPRMVQRLDRRITDLADQILDRASARGGIELISEYASIIPITIISELLGVPVGDMEKFRTFICALVTSQMLGRTSDALEAAKSRLSAHLNAVFDARRKAPRDDMVTALVRVEQEGDRLSANECIGMVYLLLLAGFITTTNLIGNGVLALLRHPAQIEMLRQNPALAGTAVEELLRFDSPLEMSSASFASTDVEVGGVRIPRGARVRVLIASANRDEQRFASPDTLDITRDPCPHLSFGSGIHHCLGAPLARLEGRIAIARLIERAPSLRLADPAQVRWSASHPTLRGLQQLPLRL